MNLRGCFSVDMFSLLWAVPGVGLLGDTELPLTFSEVAAPGHPLSSSVRASLLLPVSGDSQPGGEVVSQQF